MHGTVQLMPCCIKFHLHFLHNTSLDYYSRIWQNSKLPEWFSKKTRGDGVQFCCIPYYFDEWLPVQNLHVHFCCRPNLCQDVCGPFMLQCGGRLAGTSYMTAAADIASLRPFLSLVCISVVWQYCCNVVNVYVCRYFIVWCMDLTAAFY